MSSARVLGAVLLLSVVCSGATITVDLTGAGDFTDIQSALDAASDGDTVLVSAGEYVVTAPLDFNRLHVREDPASPPVKNIVVRSAGLAADTIVRMADTPDAPDYASVVVFQNRESADSAVIALTLTGGRGDYGLGGGVCCLGGASLL